MNSFIKCFQFESIKNNLINSTKIMYYSKEDTPVPFEHRVKLLSADGAVGNRLESKAAT